MGPGDIARFVNLKRDDLNGQYVEILTGLVRNEVLESDGVRRLAARYGIRVIESEATGYARPENLEHQNGLNLRAVELHLFGWPSDEPGFEQERTRQRQAKAAGDVIG